PNTIIIGPVNGSLISTNKPTFVWTFNDYDSNQQKAFQVQISGDSKFENITFDTGEQTTTAERWEFPTGTSYIEMPDGKWYWKMRTKDEDDTWTEFSSPQSLHIDTQAPSSATTIPFNNAVYYTINTVTGIGIDGATGSGIEKVEISIVRLTDNYYWGGKSWMPLNTWLPTNGTVNWTYDSSTIPWKSGIKYSVQSRAMDNALNTEVSLMKNTFTIDRQGPTSSITYPWDGIWYNNVDSIYGNSLDFGGAGVGKIEVSIQCSNDFISWDEGPKMDFYWDGASWVAGEHWLTADGSTQWNLNTSNVEFTTGDHYTIRSRGSDTIQNREEPGAGVTFMYDSIA
ncbi:MAG: hypothetical protein KAJ51_00095, partial [Thermoplasmata archaeon]|nr:hypothetical protein [Thermoplasmata archaeon]